MMDNSVNVILHNQNALNAEEEVDEISKVAEFPENIETLTSTKTCT